MSCASCGRDHDGTRCPSNQELLRKALDPRTRPVQMSLDEAIARLSRAVEEVVSPVEPASRRSSMSIEEACASLSSDVYRATELFEQLESAQLVGGNGHHARQRVASRAVEMLRGGEATRQRIVDLVVEELRDRWKGPKPAASTTPLS
jgi:hypothetical protein